jgi:peptidoglycan/LPS O-acetylase OafA/YrhL
VAESKQTNYVPSLDGLRAISILMVIYAHLSVTHVLPRIVRASTLGDSAVIVFFVLSGFLITSQLQSELVRLGGIRLFRFYLRRIFRLVPALMLMVSVAAMFASYGLVPLSKTDVIRAITYTADYYHPQYWTVAHLWSLSVEEQFYLIWPLILLLAGLKRSRTFTIAAILLCPVLRVTAWYAGMDEALVFRRFELVADALAIGCLLALEHDRFRSSRIWKSWNPSLVIAFSGVVVIGCSLVHRLWPVSEVIGRSFIGLASVLIVGAAAFFPTSSATRILSWPPLVWLGKISYSVYLWQQMFLVSTPGVSEPPLPFPVDLFSALGCAILSYYFFEAPIRNFGKHLTERNRKIASLVPGTAQPERVEA